MKLERIKAQRRPDGLSGLEAQMTARTMLIFLADAVAGCRDDDAKRRGVMALRKLNAKQMARMRLTDVDFAARGLDS